MQFGQQDREYIIARGQAPVEEDRTAGMELDVEVPRMQARSASLALTGLVASAIFAIFALGPQMLFVAWLVVTATTFLWLLWSAAHWVADPEIDGHRLAIAPLDLVTIGWVCLLPGFILWCLNRVVVFVVPTLTLPDALQPVRELWKTFAPLAGILSVVASSAYWMHIELAFFQELAQRSPHQEQHVWSAIGQLLLHYGKRYEPKRDRPIIVTRNGSRDSSRSGRDSKRGGETGSSVKSRSPRAPTTDLEAFLVDGETIGYARSTWVGKTLSNGTRVTRSLWDELTDTLTDAGWMESDYSGTRLTDDLSVVLSGLSRPTPHRGMGFETPSPSRPPARPPALPPEKEEE